MSTDEIRKLMRKCATEISEQTGHSVQIMSCFTENGMITPLYEGVGSWYERRGLSHDFIESDQARTTAHELGEVINQEPPDEDWKQQSS